MLAKLAFRNLFRNPRRTTVVLLIVALGASALFLFHGFNAGIMNQYRANTIKSRYGHGQIFTKSYRDSLLEKPWEAWINDYDSLGKELLSIDGVMQVFPRINFYGLLSNGQKNISGRGQGVVGEQEYRFFDTINIIHGKNLSSENDGIILGLGLAKALGLKVGDLVTVLANTVDGSLNGVDTYVTGIFHTGSKEFDDSVFRIQLKEAQVLLDTKKVETISLGLDQIDSWKNVETFISKRYLNAYEAVPFHVLDKIYYQNSVDWLNSQFAIIQIIILTIVVLGIISTVSTSIFERKQEIGMLRANGESKWGVFSLLTLEGIYLGIIGALIGIVFSLIINTVVIPDGILMPPAPGLTRQFFVKIELSYSMAAYSFLMGAFTACIGAVLSALKVVNIPVAEALRSS